MTDLGKKNWGSKMNSSFLIVYLTVINRILMFRN